MSEAYWIRKPNGRDVGALEMLSALEPRPIIRTVAKGRLTFEDGREARKVGTGWVVGEPGDVAAFCQGRASFDFEDLSVRCADGVDQ